MACGPYFADSWSKAQISEEIHSDKLGPLLSQGILSSHFSCLCIFYGPRRFSSMYNRAEEIVPTVWLVGLDFT